MHYLHENRNQFGTFVSAAAQHLNVAESIVEKDYYVTLMLSLLSQMDKNIVFKGGTSLSKCYQIVHRFSEDIDLNYFNGNHRATEKMRIEMSKAVTSCADQIRLRPVNFDPNKPIANKRRFLRYVYDYEPIFAQEGIVKPRIEIETGTFANSLPIERKRIHSLPEKMLCDLGREDLAVQLGMSGSVILTQSLERTYIDKLFAIADYARNNDYAKHSRHLYDLYQIARKISLSDLSENFILYVRLIRSIYTDSISSKPDVNLGRELRQIITQDTYKEDYIQTTSKLLFDNADYETVKCSLQETVDLMDDMPCFQEQDSANWEKLTAHVDTLCDVWQMEKIWDDYSRQSQELQKGILWNIRTMRPAKFEDIYLGKCQECGIRPEAHISSHF